ncbi:hypothetical protein [Brevundimonas sp. GCM10030266]|uniref:hypothetical protein n=1 Tax=Brevundimonas sp. GCM10030266 TaxID=3273386 RepID=UPI00360DE059
MTDTNSPNPDPDDDIAWPEEGGATDKPKPGEEDGWGDGGEDGEGRADVDKIIEENTSVNGIDPDAS